MNRSRRKKFNTIDAASLARWIVITTFFALTGLIYVYRTIQLHDLADRKKIGLRKRSSRYERNEMSLAIKSRR